MPHSFGYRARTRHLFARGHRQHGPVATQVILKTFKLGDIVDIKGNGSIHKGMPHKFYHGKTGIVWNVTKRAIGVEVNKLVGNKILAKRIHVRIEHVKASKSRQDFLNRVTSNTAASKAAKASGVKATLKRLPEGPRPAAFIRTKAQTVYPAKFVGLYQ